MVKKAVVLAAGSGTRLRPITNAIPKEMVRVGRRPTIEHVLMVLNAGGVSDVTIIVAPGKHAIMDYLDSGEKWDMDICYKVQREPKGTAHAVSLASKCIGDGEDFVIMYGDNYITPYKSMESIVNFHNDNGGNTIVLHKVMDPRRYGIVKLEGNIIKGLIEKPTIEEAQPYKIDDYWLNIAGLMILNHDVFDYIDKIKPGKSGELWLTDAIDEMRKDGNKMYGYIFDEGKRYDIGTFKSLAQADIQAQKDDKKFR